MTLGLAASRHNPDRGEAEAARQAGEGDEHPSPAKSSLKNVLNSSNKAADKAADKAGKSVKIAPDTTDKTTETAPAVTHEVVKPEIHEVMHEQIERDIHEHHVVQKILPVIDVEVLPARHYVQGEDGRLVEVKEAALPECTGENQNWHIGEGSSTGNMRCSTGPSDKKKGKHAGTQENLPPALQEGSQPVKRHDVARTEDTVIHTTVAGARQER
ncbi:hypothetical protein QBC38DRAFT_457703 [Podospora fimiseda]|uniref:Uncharacterized protein n=1 Tax=Podospora fimiseda TaxID=252190 RepID=A0AAN7BKP7_9PEZI|nr:hypothetical protein QBC38DRAFT_457703 [Podospora fimiseda]